MRLITNKSDLEKYLPASWAEGFMQRKKAVETYLETGGIIKIGEHKGNWPRLIYPTKEKLRQELDEVEKELAKLDKQLAEAKRRRNRLQTTPGKMVKVAMDPLYWEHRMKLLKDREYREVYELVRPPFHLMHMPEWRKRLEVFVKSAEYRARLKEARLSKIGKRRELLDKEVERRMDFSRSVVDGLIEKLEAKRDKLVKRADALRTLMGWAEAS